MPSTMRSVAAAALVLAALAASGAAGAQTGPFRQAGLDLTREDMAMIEGAAERLLAAAGPRIGDQAEWSNPASGNAGTVTLTALYSWESLPCRRMLHRITTKTRRDPFAIEIDRCRTATGEWKIKS